MSDEENESEDKKPMEQLRELREQYPEINDVIISKSTINKILSNIYTSSNFSEKSEGVIFGRMTENQIIISSLIPSTLSEFPHNNLTNYLDTSRLDSTKIGFYLCNPGDEFLSHPHHRKNDRRHTLLRYELRLFEGRSRGVPG